MTVNLRTRVELTCWDLIIPMMTRLRDIRKSSTQNRTKQLTIKQFITQIFIWSATGLTIGFGLSYLYVLLK